MMTTDFTMSPPPGYANWQGTPTPSKQNAFQGFLSSFGDSFKAAFPSMAIGAASSLAGSFLNNMFARRNARLQLQNQKSLMDYQQKLQADMLAAEMPLKMQSYRNAGLSTAALAGQFGGNVSVPGGSAGMPNATPANIGDVSVTDLLQARMIGLDMKEKEANINLINQEASKTKAEENAININAGLEGVYGAPTREANISATRQQIKNWAAQEQESIQNRLNSMKITDAKIREIDETLQINWRNLTGALKLMAAQAYERYTAGEVNKQRVKEGVQSVVESQYRCADIFTHAGLNVAAAYELTEKAQVYAPQIYLLEQQGKIAEAQALREQYRAECETAVPKWLQVSLNVTNQVLDTVIKGTQAYGGIMTGGMSTSITNTTNPNGQTTTTQTTRSYTPIWQQ